LTVLALFLAGERFPFRGGVGFGISSRPAGFRHGGRGGRHLDGVLRARQPDLLAPGTADRTAGGTQGGQIDGVRCCTMGANDVHGAHLHSVFARMLHSDR
jgi:hypothetical protein